MKKICHLLLLTTAIMFYSCGETPAVGANSENDSEGETPKEEVTPQNDFERMKYSILTQLLSDESEDQIVADIAKKYFPNGAPTDQCIMELVAYALPEDNAVKALLDAQDEYGAWDNIDYTSQSRSAWKPLEHVKNIMKIARCYKNEKSSFYNDPEVLAAICRSIEFWCDGGAVCPNWWYNAIGVPKVFAPILLLLEDDLTPELMAKGIAVLEPAEREMTGQNKVWLNGVTLIKGILLRDESILERTSREIKSELGLSSAEGIQYDYSFHQHGAQQQFGNYGLAFASSMSYWMRVLSGTAYDFTAEQKDIMRNYMTRGINVTVWHGFMDVSSCGRQLFKAAQAGKAGSLMTSNINMIEVDKEAQKEYEGYIVRNFVAEDQNDLIGHFAFPLSKYAIHRTRDYFFSVKMCSDRVIGGEVTNNENLKGYHLADGATMIYRTGREYNNIFAIWDGKYMPGTTVEINDEPLKVLSKARPYLNGSAFVGCMGEGEYGLSAMEYRRDGVEANKSWFFFGDQVVCLGNGLKSSRGDEMVTTLNQCHYLGSGYSLQDGAVTMMAQEETYSAPRVYNYGIGYESLDSSSIEFGVRQQKGDWHDVAQFYPSSVEQGNVFMAQIKHGDSDSYAYVVKPTAQQDEFLMGEDKNNFKVLQNDNVATAVESVDGDCVMVVFWSAGSVESTSCGVVSASKPSMLMVQRKAGEVVTTTYDPTARKIEI